MSSLARRNYRSELNRIDWEFRDSSPDLLARFHWYPARYVRQVPGVLMNYFSDEDETVLDPFCGSGTTLVEAMRFGRHATGIDLNPIAALIARAKVCPYDRSAFAEAEAEWLADAGARLTIEYSPSAWLERGRDRIPNFEENCSWYHAETLRELGALWEALDAQSRPYSGVFLAAFSSILRFCSSQTKHWGWICDNVKPHEKVYRNAFKRVRGQLKLFRDGREALEESAGVHRRSREHLEIDVIEADARCVLGGIPSASIDSVITSPPYLGMTDYTRSQRLTLLWLKKSVTITGRGELGARYKRFRRHPEEEYLAGMESILSALERVLKPGRVCCFVFGRSPTERLAMEDFLRVAENAGLPVVESFDREISRQRAQSPVLTSESVLVMRKAGA